MARQIATIDLSQSPEAVKAALIKAACSVGFAQLVNHGLPQEDIDAAFER